MEFLQMKLGQYCGNQKQAEKQGIRDAAGNYFLVSNSSSSHGSASYSNHQRLRVGPTFDVDHVAEEDAPGTRRSYHEGAAAGSGTETKIQDLARRSTTTIHDVVNHHESYKVHGRGDGSGGGGKSWSTMEEREHMFDKVVTPSDVGKLNRLVIPKQHAERYLPLIIANKKGLLLNFEDRNGKPWRFRYSYWSSSQSYVITKGWSRFVKEKQLDAGDVVSFQRGAGESGKARLYIDWRRNRLHPPPPPPYHHHHHQVLHVHRPTASSSALSTIPSSARLYQPVPNYNSMYMPIIGPYNNKMKQRESCSSGGGIDQLGQPLQYYCDLNFRSLATPRHQIGELQSQPPVIINSSVPVIHDSNAAAAAPKRLRLFGVNMDCSSISKGQQALPSVPYVNSSPPSGLFPLRL